MKVKKELARLIDQAALESFRSGTLNPGQVDKFVHLFKKMPRVEAIGALDLYLRRIKEITRQSTLTVESTFRLTQQQLKAIEKTLAKTYHIAQTEARVNPTLLGGLKVTIGDTVIDSSVKAKIATLGERIAHNG